MKKQTSFWNGLRVCRWLPAVLVGLASCISDDDPGSGDGLRAGDKVPAFEVTLSDSTVYDSMERDGNVVVLTFFHTGCGDCRRELPVLEQVYRAFEGESGVRFVSISREEEESSVAAYWQANGLTMPYAPQTDRRIYRLFAESGIPRTYVIDTEGTIRRMFSDNPPATAAQLQEAIRSVQPKEQ